MPGHTDEALGGQVDHEVRVGDLEERAHRGQVAKIGLEKGHLGAEMVDVLRLAPPPVGAEDLRPLGEGVLGHVAPHKPGDAGDQHSHPGRSVRRFGVSRSCGDYTLRLTARVQNGPPPSGRGRPSLWPYATPRTDPPRGTALPAP